MKRRYYSGRNVGLALEIEDLRHMAKRRLPAFVSEYIEGGAEDEITLHRNREAFNDIRFVHRALVDVSKRDVTSRVFNEPIGLPCAIAPTGFNGLLWKNADIALAKAARTHNIPFTVSTVSSDSLDAVAKQAGGRLWFQLYVLRDEKPAETLIARADAAGCEALILTLDAPQLGNRAWDRRSFARPLKLKLRAKLDVLTRLRWLFHVFLPRGLPGFGNLAEFLPANRQTAVDGASYIGGQTNASLTWEHVARLRDRWPRKLVLKGLLALEDIERATTMGVDAVAVSNHGGRQLDGDVSAMEILPEAVRIAAGKMSVFVDGGFTRGSDIAKAIALGADCVLLGRSTLYGVAAGGEAGATRALDILREELDRVLALLGCPAVSKLSPDFLAAVHQTE